MRLSAVTIVPREFNLVGPAGPLDSSAQPVQKRLVASMEWAFALAKMDVQGWFLVANMVLPPSSETINDKVPLWSRTDAERDVWEP